MGNNGYIPSLFPTDRCFTCGFEGQLVRHEIFQGPYRQKSKEFGTWVTLCPRCHMDLHEHPADYRWLKQQAQMKAMKAHDWTVEEFRNEFGKNYL